MPAKIAPQGLIPIPRANAKTPIAAISNLSNIIGPHAQASGKITPSHVSGNSRAVCWSPSIT
ncbi:MAG: hypothetical protein WCO96_07105 [Actinomycetes bacterium]